MQIAPFDPTKKKKKKKVVIQDIAEDDRLSEKIDNLSRQSISITYHRTNFYFSCLRNGIWFLVVADGVENAFVGMKNKKKKRVSF